MMEQRSEIMKRLNVNRKQSILLEQEIDGRLIKFRIRKPSSCDFEDQVPLQCQQQPQSPSLSEHLSIMDGNAAAGAAAGSSGDQQQTSGSPPRQASASGSQSQLHNQQQQDVNNNNSDNQQDCGSGKQPTTDQNSRTASFVNNMMRPNEINVCRMHTALTLNEAILKRSKSAKLVIINLPAAPTDSTPEAENNCKFKFSLPSCNNILPNPFAITLSGLAQTSVNF